MSKDAKPKNCISIKGAREHNLKNIDIDIPKNELIVITGVSGSGKSSLAFDTIYSEGKRLYMNSLSSYIRHIEINDKPDVDDIRGLSPTIAIEQKNSTRNPRSTVATITEVYDYLRVFFARVGTPYSPHTGEKLVKSSPDEIVNTVLREADGKEAYFVVPSVEFDEKEHRSAILNFKRHDCSHVTIDGKIHDIKKIPHLSTENSYVIEGISRHFLVVNEMPCKQAIIHQVYKCLMMGHGLMFVDIVDNRTKEKTRLRFSEKYYCPESGFQIDEIEPKLFSFNSPHGACPQCDGLGLENIFSVDLMLPNHKVSLSNGLIAPWEKVFSKTLTTQQKKNHERLLDAVAKHFGFNLTTPFEDLSDEMKKILLYGSDEIIKFTYGSKSFSQKFEGIIKLLQDYTRDNKTPYVTEELKKYQIGVECSACKGTRLKPESLAIRVVDQDMGSICKMTIIEIHTWFGSVIEKLAPSEKEIASKIISEVMKKLGFLIEIGVGYLTLNRRSMSLSGGESQRIKIASQLGCGLEGIIYVLDEPSIGLHQSDNDKLINIMRGLCHLGNTVIVVEHDEDTIKAADYLIDIGPGAGVLGGQIMASGTPAEVAKVTTSITGKYLSGELKIKVPTQRRQFNDQRYLEVIGATSFNLKNLDIKIPLGCLVAVTGVSGSGKSTFAIHTLYKALSGENKEKSGQYKQINGLEHIDKIIQVDQSPIGRTPRSNPVTYINAFSGIRDCFAGLPEAKNLGYKSGCFSFNVKGGRCEACEGDGYIKIEMHFMPDIFVKCDTCNGMRYHSQILQIKYKGHSIADVLNMTTDEAVKVFEDTPIIHEKLLALQDVGLGYLKIGQSATTLSGGEAQRIKLAKELAKRMFGSTLYILDEPTTGLHSHDISRLLDVMHKLVDSGHSMLVIEHNLDVIKNADHVIDFGPQGGMLGGEVVAAGTPEEVCQNPRSLTGKYLKDYL